MKFLYDPYACYEASYGSTLSRDASYHPIIRGNTMLDVVYVGLILVLYAIVAAFVNFCEKLIAAATDRSGSMVVRTGYSKDGAGDAES